MNLLRKLKNNTDVHSRINLLFALIGLMYIIGTTVYITHANEEKNSLLGYINQQQQVIAEQKEELDSIHVAFAELSSNTEKALAENEELQARNQNLLDDQEHLNSEVERLKKLLRTLE